MTTNTFDYIVIGAGSAGAVVANRLAKAGTHSVLVLEAGPKDNNPMIRMPGGTAETLKSDKYNWKLDCEPQVHLNGRKLLQHRGKMLGGSSNLNGMVAIRGNRACYDAWEAQGNKGWGYTDVLEHFKAIENWCDRNGDDSAASNPYHGTSGELPIRRTSFQSILFDQFIAAGQELGLALNTDFNGEQQEGVGRYHANVYKGERWGSARAFLDPIKQQANVSIETNIQVEKILFEGNRAIGVQASQKGKTLEFKANKSIVLSAGSFLSPHILMNSGIGCADKLKALNIPVIKDLPGVGENLQDHLSLLMTYGCSLPITMNGPSNSVWQQIKIAYDYFAHKRGVGSHNMIEVGGFLHSKEGLAAPDIQLHMIPALMRGLTDKLPKQHGISIRACNLTPHSRGVVELKSNDPLVAPKIDFRFLSDERDQQVIISAFKFVERLAKAKAWNGVLGDETRGGTAAKTDDEIMELVRQYIDTDYHPVGTCKMGSDAMSVVDDRLRVHGIEGLRVADASIMPTIVRGNTNLPCMMIGDKAGKMLLEEV